MAKVTITDLARELGLAKSAVSYALNDQPGVSNETRRRVKELAELRGWHPSSVARALSGGRAGAVGIVLNREPVLLAEEPWYQLVIAGVEDVLIDADIGLMLRMVGMRGGRGRRTYRQWSQERRVDGVLVFDGERDDKRLPLLRDLGLPAVLIGFRAPGFSSVSADSESEARLLIDHLADRGVRTVLHISGPTKLGHELRRRQGLQDACESRGLQTVVSEADYTVAGGQRVSNEALDQHPLDAIVCSNDLMAIGALTAASDRGLDVPDQLKIASWDYSALTRASRPQLTALDRDAMGFGRRGARLLLDEIDGEDSRSEVVVPAHLVPGGTT